MVITSPANGWIEIETKLRNLASGLLLLAEYQAAYMER